MSWFLSVYLPPGTYTYIYSGFNFFIDSYTFSCVNVYVRIILSMLVLGHEVKFFKKKSIASIGKIRGVNKKYGVGRDEIVRGAKNIFAPFTVVLHARSAVAAKVTA